MKNSDNKLAVFRCDASTKIGSGHIMRCITLGNQLKSIGFNVIFICRAYDGNLIELTRKQFKVLILEKISFKHDELRKLHGRNIYEDWLGCSQIEDAQGCIKLIKEYSLKSIDLLVIDHYSLDLTWEEYVIKFIKLNNYTDNYPKVFVIDDLADRRHNCDFLLDQTFLRTKLEYEPYVNDNCKLLLGTDFAILRGEFKKIRLESLKRKNKNKNKNVERILIYLGSFYDMDAITIIFKILSELPIAKLIDVDFISPISESDIKYLYKSYFQFFNKLDLFNFTENIAQYLYQSDLCIGAAGSSTWERCALGIPSINIITDENQAFIGENLLRSNVANVIYLNKNFKNNFRKSLDELVFNNNYRYLLSKSSSQICDANGTQRFIDAIEK